MPIALVTIFEEKTSQPRQNQHKNTRNFAMNSEGDQLRGHLTLAVNEECPGDSDGPSKSRIKQD